MSEHTPFEEFLHDKYIAQTEVFADSIAKNFDGWLSDIEPDDFIRYAEKWQNKLIAENKRLRDSLKELVKQLREVGSVALGDIEVAEQALNESE